MKRRDVLAGIGAAAAWPALPRFARGAEENGVTVLTAMPANAPLLGSDQPQTPVWVYDGVTPGPELRVRQGEELRVRLENHLDQPTTIHWHGLRIDNSMDGVAGLTQDAVPPGESFEYAFTPPDAGTYWYHSHVRSWEQMARGLYGALIVDEREPTDYGMERTLVLDDWRLDEAGAIHEASMGHLHDWAHAGRYGNWLTVNGASTPTIDIAADAPTRLRIINTCNARITTLTIAHEAVFVVALDGQPVPPSALDGAPLPVAPAQRVDLAIAGDIAPDSEIAVLESSGEEPVQIAALRPVRGSGASDHRTALALPDNPIARTLDLDTALRMPLLMEGGAMGGLQSAVYKGEDLPIRDLAGQGKVWAFNGVVDLPEAPLFTAQLGQTVVVEMSNRTAWPHAMHLHGHHFRAVSLNGVARSASPWRDTLLSEVDDDTHIAFVADNPGKWLLHCHMAEHMAAGMVTWFEVTA